MGGTSLLGRVSLRRANLIVQNTLDYASSSPPVLSHYLSKTIEIPTPVNVSAVFDDVASDDAISDDAVSNDAVASFKARFGIASDDIVLGLAGRVAREKGYEYLLEALPAVLEAFPNARVVHAGAWKGVIGEEAYQAQITEMASGFGEKWMSTGYVSDEDFLAFFLRRVMCWCFRV